MEINWRVSKNNKDSGLWNLKHSELFLPQAIENMLSQTFKIMKLKTYIPQDHLKSFPNNHGNAKIQDCENLKHSTSFFNMHAV